MPSGFPTADDLYTDLSDELGAAGSPLTGFVAGTDTVLEALLRAFASVGGVVSGQADALWGEIDIESAGKSTLAKWYAVAGLTWPGDDEITVEDARAAVKAFFQNASAGTREWYRLRTLAAGVNKISVCHVALRLTGPTTVHLFVGRGGGVDPLDSHLTDLQTYWDDDENHLAGAEVYVLKYSQIGDYPRLLEA